MFSTSEVAEPHLLLEENSFPASSTIPKDNDPKRVDALIEAMHADILKKEVDYQQKTSFPSNDSSKENATIISNESAKRSLRTSHVNFRLSDHRSIHEDKEDLSVQESQEPATDSSMPVVPLDLEQLVSDDISIHSLTNYLLSSFLVNRRRLHSWWFHYFGRGFRS